jgi:hypothetical protein
MQAACHESTIFPRKSTRFQPRTLVCYAGVISLVSLKHFSTQGVGMHPTTRGIIIAEMLISAFFIGALVFCDAYVNRVWIGAGGGIIVPTMVYAGAMRIKKIGYDSGETKTIADLLREHTRIHSD